MNIGYYAHHHGSGHCRQAEKLATFLPKDGQKNLIVFTSLSAAQSNFSTIDESQVVRLAAEEERLDEVVAGRASRHFMPESLHYSPVGNADIQERSWQLLDSIRRFDIDLMIIDVSVEVAMLCRAASIPYLYVRLAGNRNDPPHLNAFAGALGLLAPYPATFEAQYTPDWVCQKTLYLGFLAQGCQVTPCFDQFLATLNELAENNSLNQQVPEKIAQYKQEHANNTPLTAKKTALITVIKGFGGHKNIDDKLQVLRQQWSNALIISLGPIGNEAKAYVDIAATVSEVTPFIAFSDYVLMACGLNAIAQAVLYPTPLIALPDERPHDEQQVMASALINQQRAMSWSQFLAYSTTLDAQLLPKALQDQTALDNSLDDKMAVDFMTSLAVGNSVKAWFEDWLLPKFKVSPTS